MVKKIHGGIMRFLLTLFLLASVATAQEITQREQTKSVKFLQAIGGGMMVYTIDNDEAFPDKVGAAGLEQVRNQYLMKPVFIAPFDKQSTVAKDNEKLMETNTTYAYIGSGLSNGKGYSCGRVETPLAFEKPWLRKDGKVAILYLSGNVFVKNIKADNCLEVVNALRKDNYPNEPYWNNIIASAKAIDKAHGITYSNNKTEPQEVATTEKKPTP